MRQNVYLVTYRADYNDEQYSQEFYNLGDARAAARALEDDGSYYEVELYSRQIIWAEEFIR